MMKKTWETCINMHFWVPADEPGMQHCDLTVTHKESNNMQDKLWGHYGSMVEQEVKDEPHLENDSGGLQEDLGRIVSLHPAMTEQVTSEIRK